ncbi:GNAT family N-acetyltransferase [Henriciella sp. AS95]|uniref:GNAT family N-acetyltransferase n=1 Tax=Henriciella sp. AS95 TaxID=3135782 RepID=UPI0031812DBA
MEIRRLSKSDVGATYPVMSQLRPHISEAEYPVWIERVLADGAHIIAAWRDGRCIGCATYRQEFRLATGDLVYVDDLVTDMNARSTGVGKALIDWVEAEANRLGAKVLILDSGTQRERAHAFYFREGFTITSFNFKKPLD